MKTNYILKLQEERNELRERLQRVQDEMSAFVAHLHSAKFRGVDPDGHRRDWIATGDVLNWLAAMRRETIVNPARRRRAVTGRRVVGGWHYSAGPINGRRAP
jgi:hypothetical protein